MQGLLQFGQQVWAMVRLAPQHHAITPLQGLEHTRNIAQAAIHHDGERRELLPQAAHNFVAQRRHLAVVLGGQTPEHGLAPMRIFTVTGTLTAARMAATHSATSSGSSIRQAPKEPLATRSLGQPQLRLISS